MYLGENIKTTIKVCDDEIIARVYFIKHVLAFFFFKACPKNLFVTFNNLDQ